MMGMYFDITVMMKNFLFEGWDTDSWQGVLVAASITCVLTGIFEGLKVLRSYLGMRRAQSCVVHGAGDQRESSASGVGNEVNSSQADLLSSLRIPMHDVKDIRHRKIILFSLESLLHMFNFFYAYILMLIVMTYSVWLMIAVLVGSGVGYYFINPVGQCLAFKYMSPMAKPIARPSCMRTETQRQEASNEESKKKTEESTRVNQAPVKNYQSVMATTSCCD